MLVFKLQRFVSAPYGVSLLILFSLFYISINHRFSVSIVHMWAFIFCSVSKILSKFQHFCLF
jgi:hypothetical protein